MKCCRNIASIHNGSSRNSNDGHDSIPCNRNIKKMILELRKTIFFMFVLQGVNYLIPLITLPILAQALEVKSFGQLNFIISIFTFASIFIDWGFNIGAVKDIAEQRSDVNWCSQIFIGSLIFRLVLAMIAFVAILLFTHFRFESFQIDGVIYACAISLFANAISPQFVFHGHEKISFYVFLSIIFRLLSLPLVYQYVTRPSDMVNAALLFSMPILLTNIFSIVYIIRAGLLVFIPIKVGQVYDLAMKYFPLFLSNASISVYTTLTPVILGIVSTDDAVGYFVIGYTIVKTIVSIMGPLSQTLFPRISHLIANDYEAAIASIIKIMYFQMGVGFLLSLAAFFIAPYATSLVFGSYDGASDNVIRILSPLPFLISCSNVLGIQTMVTLGLLKEFSFTLTITSFINVIFVSSFSYVYGEAGAAFAMLLTELFVVFLMAFFVNKRIPFFFRSFMERTYE